MQETLVDAAQELDDYLRDRPLPFYAWLRQLARDRLVELHRRHVRARSRSVAREEPEAMSLSDEPMALLARRLVSSATSPSRRLMREELRDHVRRVLEDLAPRDREVLIMRRLEQLTTSEIAGVLEIREGAVRTRHVRALERLRRRLDDNSPEEWR